MSALSGEIIYVAGPMRGLPDYNYPAFNTATAMLRARGASVVSPVEVCADDEGPHYPEWYMRRCLRAIAGPCDDLACSAIALLPGWERSIGARCEVVVGLTLGLRFYDATTGERIERPARVVCDGGYA